MASLGCFASVCPGLLTITGLAGRGRWADFFLHLSKLGVAIKRQHSHPARVAVVRAFCRRLRRVRDVSDDWKQLLRPVAR